MKRRGRRPSPSPPTLKPGLAVHPALLPDLLTAQALARTADGRRYLQVANELWQGTGLRCRAVFQRRRRPSDATIAGISLGLNPEVNRALAAFLPPSLPQGGGGVPRGAQGPLVLAYFARAGQRDDLTLEALAEEMAGICLWLLAVEELGRRLQREPLGMILWFVHVTSRWPARRRAPLQGMLHELVTIWTATAEKGAPLSWAADQLGEPDLRVAWEERRANVGRRLAEELHRRRDLDPGVLALEVLRGRVRWHKVAAWQAILGERRPERERHELEEDLDEGLDAAREHDRHRPRVAPEDVHTIGPRADLKPRPRPEEPIPPEGSKLAGRIIRAYRLPREKAKVIRYMTTGSGGLSIPAIARGAGVSEATVRATKETIRRLAGDTASLRRLLFPG